MTSSPHASIAPEPATTRGTGLGIRAKVMLPMALLAVILGMVGVVLVQRTSAQREQRRLYHQAAAVAHAVKVLSQEGCGDDRIQQYIHDAARQADVASIVVTAGDPPVVVAATRPEWIGRPTGELSAELHATVYAQRAQQGHHRVAEGPGDRVAYAFALDARSHAAEGTLPAGVVTVHLHRRVRGVGVGSAVVPVAAVVLVWTLFVVGVGYVLLRQVVLNRIDKIVGVVRAIIAGDRQVRIESGKTDELGELAAALDDMVDELVAREDAEQVASEFTLKALREQHVILREMAGYRMALDRHASVAVTDCDGVILEVNDRFCEVTQYSREELIGRNQSLVDAGNHSDAFWEDLRRQVTNGEVWEGEICNRAKDGSVLWFDTTIVPFKDESGCISKFIEIRPDITERKLAEEALRDSKEQFELAVRGSNHGIWDWNLVTGQIYLSRRFKQLLGYEDDEFPSRPRVLRKCVHPEDAAEAIDTLRNHLRGTGAYDVNLRLRTKAGHWRWYRVRGEAVRDETGRARRMAGSLSDIHSLKCAQEDLETAALFDKLTGLPNRTLLLDRARQMLHRARRTKQHNYAVMFLDFDRFKLVNDSYGHGVGDALLKEIAARISGQLRSEDSIGRTVAEFTAARQGGDEFVILLDGLHQREDAVVVAERLLAEISRGYRLGPHEVYSTASIGIVLGSPAYDCADDLMRDADTAMYEAKRAGKGRCVVFDADMRFKLQRRVHLEHDLRKAMQQDELFLAYQPIVSMATGALVGVEGLIRWFHPQEGLVGPSEFIPIAEESDLISQLGQWVMAIGCRDMVQWRQLLGDAAPAVLSLNLSRKQFNDPGLVDQVRQVLDDSGVAPGSIQLEITEDAFASNLDAAIGMMHALKQAGVRLAIDDFGIGHSSFASLHKFPVDVLKIDRSLAVGVQDCQNTAALIHSLAVLVKNLGIRLVIEGVENEMQLIALSELGCDYAQGFFFGRPMSSDALMAFLSQPGKADPCVEGAMSFARRWKDRLAVFEDNLSS